MNITPTNNTNFKAYLDISKVKTNKARWANIAKMLPDMTKKQPYSMIEIVEGKNDTKIRGRIQNVDIKDGKISFDVDNSWTYGDFEYIYSFQQQEADDNTYKLTQIDKAKSNVTGYKANDWNTRVFTVDIAHHVQPSVVYTNYDENELLINFEITNNQLLVNVSQGMPFRNKPIELSRDYCFKVHLEDDYYHCLGEITFIIRYIAPSTNPLD